jgi:apolipoprotein N-acyltransferase
MTGSNSRRTTARMRSSSRERPGPLIRADWRFGSAIYDGDGRQLANAGRAKRRAVLVAEVRPAAARTSFAHLGDTFGWLAAGATATLWLAAAGRRRRWPSTALSADGL